MKEYEKQRVTEELAKKEGVWEFYQTMCKKIDKSYEKVNWCGNDKKVYFLLPHKISRNQLIVVNVLLYWEYGLKLKYLMIFPYLRQSYDVYDGIPDFDSFGLGNEEIAELKKLAFSNENACTQKKSN